MCLFRKPELRVDVLFDIHTYNRYGKETMNPLKFIDSLTRKQIRMLNRFAAEAHRSDELEKEIEKEMHDEYVKTVGELQQEEIEQKMSGEFTEAERIHDGEDYANYLNNNKDKAMLTDEENQKLMAMLSGIATKKDEIIKELNEKEKKGEIPHGAASIGRTMTTILANSKIQPGSLEDKAYNPQRKGKKSAKPSKE